MSGISEFEPRVLDFRVSLAYQDARGFTALQ